MSDDPVQHIYDFRALPLVEVLSSLRRVGRQVVAAVVDEALANLLCRRTLGTPEQGGRRYTIVFNERGTADVTARLEIPPMAPGILHQFDGAQATA